jgi:hypothetical protein
MSPPPLEIVIGERRLPVPAERPFVIGRGPEADLDVGHPAGVPVELTAQGWLLTDASRNGWVLRPGSGSGRTWPGARRSPRWR